MRPKNRKNAYILFGVFETIMVACFIGLLALNRLNAFSTVIAFFVLLAVTLVGVVSILYKYPLKGEKKKDGFDASTVEVSRTREGTIFEVLTGILLIVAWAVAIATHRFTDAEGGINFESIFFFSLMSLGAISLLWDVYDPGTMNFSRFYKNARQVAIGVRMHRVMAIEIALFTLLCSFPALSIGIQVALLVVIVATFVLFGLLLHRAKD